MYRIFRLTCHLFAALKKAIILNEGIYIRDELFARERGVCYEHCGTFCAIAQWTHPFG